MNNIYLCCLALLCLFSTVQAQDNSLIKPSKSVWFSLVRTSDRDKIGSLGGDSYARVEPSAILLCNTSICELVVALNSLYKTTGVVIVDETGYSEPVDIILQTWLSDIECLKRALRIYDLDIIPREEICQAAGKNQEVMPPTSGLYS